MHWFSSRLLNLIQVEVENCLLGAQEKAELSSVTNSSISPEPAPASLKNLELFLGKPSGDIYVDDKGANDIDFFEQIEEFYNEQEKAAIADEARS